MTFSRTIIRWAGRAIEAVPVWGTILLFVIALTAFAGAVAGGVPAWMSSLLDGASSVGVVFLAIFIESVPFLLVGTLAAGLVEDFIEREELAGWIPREPVLAGLAGSLTGIFIPVGECGVIPFTRRLMEKGLPAPVGITMLLAAPSLNPIVIAGTLAVFGPGLIFWGRIGITLLIALASGLIFTKIPTPRGVLRDPAVLSSPALNSLLSPKLPFAQRVRRVLVTAADEFFELGRYLVLGALLAALMQSLIHQPDLAVLGQGPALSVVTLLGQAVLRSSGSASDAFIAVGFSGLFTRGAILAFLVYGAMIDMKSTLMLARVFKPRVVLYLVLVPMGLTLLFSVLLNVLAGQVTP